MARPIRWLYASAGLTCVGLGTLGVVVPGLPTTVFLLIATWCFTRSCPVLERWLLEHPVLGPYVKAVICDRAMPASAKAIALVSMWVAVTASVVVIGTESTSRAAIAATVVLAALIGSGFILFWVRTGRPGDGRE